MKRCSGECRANVPQRSSLTSWRRLPMRLASPAKRPQVCQRNWSQLSKLSSNSFGRSNERRHSTSAPGARVGQRLTPTELEWCQRPDVNPSVRKLRSQHTGSRVHPVHTRMSRNYCELVAPRKPFQTAQRPRRSLGLRYSWRGQDLNLRPSGYEPDELPDCSTPRWVRTTLAAAAKVKSVGVTVTTKASNDDR